MHAMTYAGDRDAMSPSLCIFLLGRFSIWYRDADVWQPCVHPLLEQRRIRLLLGFLACSHAMTTSRRQVENLLWPTVSEGEGAGELQDLLVEVQRVLDSCLCPVVKPRTPLLLASDEDVQLGCPGVWVDTAAFGTLLRAAGGESDLRSQTTLLERALQLYRGDFLREESDLEGLLPQRISLRSQAREAVAQLAVLYKSAGRLHEAACVFEWWMRFGSLDERIWREAFSTLLVLGRDMEARYMYDELATRLNDMYGLNPHPQTEALLCALQKESVRSW